MFKINRKLEYALIALKHMSSKSPCQLTSAKEICTIYQTPFDPTSRVLQIMTQNGVLKAEHGARGGYQIVSDLTELSLKNLSLMITGPIEIASCFHGSDSSCNLTSCCHIIAPMLTLNEHINRIFEGIMVADLLDSRHHAENRIRNKNVKASL